MERVKRAVSLVLCLVMVLGFLPVSAFAATDDDALTAALSEAQSYIDGITVNSSSNDPETVVKNFKTHFTWDNEKRESSKDYLFDWSYYNGVVFEGLEYLYEVTGKEDYKDYVLDYMSSLIAGDGTWAKCANNSTKECAGYNATHGADCYKTASLLLDAYELSGDGRYLTMANTLYADLDSAAAKYSLSECGGNYRHTWASDPSPDLWLDGLYMILPFRAEYAKHVGDTEELDLIVSRMQWVSDNMYDSTKGLFYHAADSASSNSGTYWLRSIGWYAAAIVDVMDSMEGENLETMKAQLVKLVDGMKACQNASNGMWLNDLNSNQSSANPYETSGTALVCYAVMKAVNNGWLDESYADMALLAFKGICEEKLDGDNLTDICFKGTPGGSNSQFEDNEGKGVGPFIMLTAEVLEHVNKKANEPVIKTDDETGVSVEAVGITGLTVAPVAVEEMAETVAEAVAEVLTGTLVAYDITVEDFTEGSTAAVTVAIPEGMDASSFGVFYVPTEGDLELMEGEAAEDGKTYTFYTTHFSTYVGGEVRAAAETGDSVSKTGSLPGSKVYTLDTNGVTANKNYLIVNNYTNGTRYALTNNNGTAGRTSVTVSNSTITVEDDTNIAWQFSGSTSGTVGNNGRYVYPNSNSLSLNENGTSMTISSQGSGAYRINHKVQSGRYTYTYYLRHNNNTWTGGTSQSNVYLYELTKTNPGATVTFTVTPGELNLMVNDTADLSYTITLNNGATVSDSDIDWSSSNTTVATVNNGKVTARTEGDTTITAKLNSVNGEELVAPIELEIPVTVYDKQVIDMEFVKSEGTVFAGSDDDQPTGGIVRVTYDNGDIEEIDVTVGMLSGSFNILNVGTYQGLTVTYRGFAKAGFTLNVEEIPYVTGSGKLPDTKVYVLDTNGVDANQNYLIVNTGSNGNGYAMTNNGTNTPGSTTVTINGGKITVMDDTKIAWVFSGSTSGTVKNQTRYIYLNNNTAILSTSSRTLDISNQNNGAYRVFYDSTYYNYYLRYYNAWRRDTSASNVYLYRYDGTETGASVTFTVAPGRVNLIPGETQNLVGTVTVGSTTVALRNCDITWASSNTGKVTVADGVVTGVANGSANITATLTAVNGNTLVTPITLTIPATVTTKMVTSAAVTTPVGHVYVGAGDAAVTGGKITLTYNDGTQKTIDITLGMLDGNFDRNTEGRYENLTVRYDGGALTDDFILNVIPKPDMNYPEFPNPGSIFVDKYIKDYTQFQNLGVAQVELTASGLPAMAGVDVILVTDFSNSMAWEAGSREDASSYEDTKMKDLQDSIVSFADVFLETKGGESGNTLSMVTFGGLDLDHINSGYAGNYADVTQTFFYGYDSADDVKEKVNGIRLIADSNYDGGYKLSFDGGETWSGNYGNTNYDYAFMETVNAINTLKAKYEDENSVPYDESGRSIYILFMTDGAPTNYNGDYYSNKSGDTRPDNKSTWINAEGEEVTYNRLNYTTAEKWYPVIAGGAYDAETDSIPGRPLYWATEVSKMTNVAEIIPIGFDIENGGFSNIVFTEEGGAPLDKVLEKMVEGETLKVYDAQDSNRLQEIYNDLAASLKLAATNAYFMDQMGDDFDLQMATNVIKPDVDGDKTYTLNPAPTITVTTYGIYTPDDVNGITITADMIGNRKDSGTVQETVTFSADGSAAYSDKVSGNILVGGVICAKNFWYNTNTTAVQIDTNGDGTNDFTLPAETFRWNIGTINNTEFVLSYPVYLEESREGNAEAGSYDTNNYADLYYTNWLGNDAKKSVESPVLAWESALVNFGFYLVNENGEPVVNRSTGETGLFADAVKVTPKIFYDIIYLNSTDRVIELEVKDHVPYGYTIYDMAAAYRITIDSAGTENAWSITTGAGLPKTTFVTDYNGSDYTTLDSHELGEDASIDFTGTTVWFGVLYNMSTVPDVVVIDYGIPVDIDVLTNDMLGEGATLVGVGSTLDKPTTENNQYRLTDSDKFGSELTSAYQDNDLLAAGDVQMLDRAEGERYARVRYTPNTMEMPTFDKFAYEVRYDNTVAGDIQYYYGDVTVIPATIIYYEDSFLEFTSLTWVDNSWVERSESLWEPEGTVADATQAEDRPGEFAFPEIDANNIYGYDQAYTDFSEYSLGGAMKAHVDYDNSAIAGFSFFGTGFDVISLTSSKSGAIEVRVYDAEADAAAAPVRTHIVDSYYGYVLKYFEVTYTFNGYAWFEELDEVTYEVYQQNVGTSGSRPEAPVADDTYTTFERRYVVDEDAENNALYQVPVMKIEGLPYGHYRVEIQVLYDPLFDHGQYSDDCHEPDFGCFDFWLDAIRIYDPANDGENDETGIIKYAYTNDHEGWPIFEELRNNLLKADSFDADDQYNLTGAVFIDGNPLVTEAEIADYLKFGPNNEVYLAEGQAVAFKLDLSGYVDENGKPAIDDVHIAMKSENGIDASCRIYYLDNSGNAAGVRTFELGTATDLYYKLPNYDKGVLVIQNPGEGLLSITNLKFTFKAQPVLPDDAAPMSLMRISGEEAQMAVMSLRRMAAAPDIEIPEETLPTVPEETEPSIPEETEPVVFVPEQLSVSFNKDSVKVGKKVKVQVTTSDEVDHLVINGMVVEKSGYDESTGCRTWSVQMTASEAGEMPVNVTAYDAQGIASEVTTVYLTVTSKK